MEIIIGGRTIPLLLSTFELIEIQDAIGCTVAQLRDEVFGVYQEDDGPEGKPRWHFGVATDVDKMKKLGTLIRITGNAGLEDAGQDADLTDKWILRNIKPSMVLPVAIVMMAVVNDAMMMETAKKEENTGPVDVTIEEENRKKEPRK